MKPIYKIDRRLLIIEYIKNLKTISEIANQIRCNPWVIKDRMKKYNIKIRAHGNTKHLRGTYKKENNPNWKGGHLKCIDCGKLLSTRIEKIKRCRKCSGGLKTGENNPNYKHGKSKNNKCVDCNKHITLASKRCHSCAKKGVLHARWTGTSELKNMIRSSRKYKNWRTRVFKRDNFTCQKCGQYNGYLEAHHLKTFKNLLSGFLNKYKSLNPKQDIEKLLKLSIKYRGFWKRNNGQTLCRKCHDLTKRRKKRDV